jgi:hypothetical protein
MKNLQQIKCILFSNNSGSKEGVIFIQFPDDSNQDEIDYIPSDCTISGTTLLYENDLPFGFPLGYQLNRE